MPYIFYKTMPDGSEDLIYYIIAAFVALLIIYHSYSCLNIMKIHTYFINLDFVMKQIPLI